MAIHRNEKQAFSRRLCQALAAAGEDDRSPTRLLREFNRRHKGDAVSIHSAHKWLRGEAIPTQDRLKTLAAWLGVTPEWLRFGETDAPAGYAVKEPPLTESDIELVQQFRRLNTGHRQVVREMLLSLLRIEQRR
jgi:transcriptional regulator with XRE-family HTH domain